MKPSASCWLYTLSLPNVAYEGWYSAYGLSRPATLALPLYSLSRTWPVTCFWVLAIAASSASRSGVHQVGIPQRDLVLQPQRAPVEDELLQLAVRGEQQRAARRLVDAARFHPHEAVLDDVGAADAVLAGDRVQRRDELHRPQRDVVHGDRGPFLEADLDQRRKLRSVQRVLGHDEDVLGRLARGIFEDAALVGAVPQVAISRIRLLGGRLHRDVLRLHVREEVFAALELPLTPRRDDLQVGAESGVGEFEADLVVTLPRAALGERDLMRRHHRPRHGRA